MQTSAQGPGADSSGAMADWAPMLPLPPIIGPRAPVPPKRVVAGGALLVGSNTALAAAYCLTAHGSYLGVGWFLGYALLVGVIPPLVAVRNLWWVQSLEGGWRARRFRAALILWVITMITGPVLVLGLR